jgi:hypothetical protein
MRAIYSLLLLLQIGYGICACSTQQVSTNKRCGWAWGAIPYGQTCFGSGFGDCCGSYGWWYVAIFIVYDILLIITSGNSSASCGVGCQISFGVCDESKWVPDPPCSVALSSIIASSTLRSDSSTSSIEVTSSVVTSSSSQPIPSHPPYSQPCRLQVIGGARGRRLFTILENALHLEFILLLMETLN